MMPEKRMCCCDRVSNDQGRLHLLRQRHIIQHIMRASIRRAVNTLELQEVARRAPSNRSHIVLPVSMVKYPQKQVN